MEEEEEEGSEKEGRKEGRWKKNNSGAIFQTWSANHSPLRTTDAYVLCLCRLW